MGKELEIYNIPNSIKVIGNGAFFGCSVLQSIDIPNSVTTIEKNAFYYCTALQSIDIPNSVTTIEESAFEFCSSLQSIDIPNSVTRIRSHAFSGCKALKSIHLHWTQLDNIQIDEYIFGEDSKVNFEERTLYVPSGKRWEYRHHPVFGQFKKIEIEKQE